MRTGLGRAAVVLCALVGATIAALAASLVAGATTSLPATGNGIVPTSIDGNDSGVCTTRSLFNDDHVFGLKIGWKADKVNIGGSYDQNSVGDDGGASHKPNNPLQVTISNAAVVDGKVRFDWSANMPVDWVFVKASNGGYHYNYTAYDWNGNPATGPWGDSGLVSPKDSISHVTFCTIKKLRVQKTAVPTFTREHQWTIDKKVKTSNAFGDSAALSLPTGGSGTATWQIVADETSVADKNPAVAGVITVLDSSPFDVTGILDESLSNVTFSGSCAAKGGTNDQATFSVGKGQTVTCAYSAPVAQKADGTNTVLADPSNQTWMVSTSASKAYAFGEPTSEINKTVRWSDSNGQSKTGITGDSTTVYDTANPCGSSRTVTNTVTLYGDNNANLGSDVATLAITCTRVDKLHIDKTVSATSFKRTWSWTIDKQVKTTGAYGDSASLTLDRGTSGDAHYKVTVHGSSVDSTYSVSGTITVKNPNATAVSGLSVTDVLPDAVVDCLPAAGNQSTGLTLAGNGTLTCTYTATSAGTKPTSNTASATVSGNSYYDNTSSAVAITFGAPTVINGSVDVTDAFDGSAKAAVAGGSGLTPADLNEAGDKVLTYDRTLSCGSTRTYGNTAYVATSGSVSPPFDEDSASVVVTCNPAKPLTVTKTATPSFTRTLKWKVTKTADPAKIDLKDGAFGSSTWTVKLEQDGAPVDSGWHLSGTITVANPNAFAVSGVAVTDVLGPVTCPAATIAPKSALVCTYSADVQSGVAGTNTATASTTTQGVGPGQGSAPYAFTQPTRTVNGNVDVVDTNGRTWNDRTQGFTESYSTGTLPCHETTYTNTARVIGDEGAILNTSTATVTVSCSSTPPPPPSPPQPVIDIGVTKSATNPTTLHGNVTYTIVVSSVGPDAASGVQVADPAPGGISYTSASSSDPAVSCAVQQGGALVSCNRPGTFTPGQSFVVTVVGKATTTGTLTNTVTVSTPGDSKPGNNLASASTLVVAPITPPTPKPSPRPIVKPKPKPSPRPSVKPKAKPKPKSHPQVCTTLKVGPKTVTVGKAGTLSLSVKAGSDRMAGTKIRIQGPGVSKVVKTGKNGIANVTIRASKSGIVVVSMLGKKGCNTARVGVVGAFEPPVTG